MAWVPRETQQRTIDKVIGGLEMAAGVALLGFTLSPWGDKYLPPFARIYATGASAALLALGRERFHHVAYEPDEHQHGTAYVHDRIQAHAPKIRQVMDYIAPKAERAYQNWRAPRYA